MLNKNDAKSWSMRAFIFLKENEHIEKEIDKAER